MASNRTVYVTRQDFELTQLLETHVSRRDKPALTALVEELGRAVVVESSKVPPDVVTMNSRVEFDDLDTGERTEVTLVYPQEGNVDQSRISVLAPVGARLRRSASSAARWHEVVATLDDHILRLGLGGAAEGIVDGEHAFEREWWLTNLVDVESAFRHHPKQHTRGGVHELDADGNQIRDVSLSDLATVAFRLPFA